GAQRRGRGLDGRPDGATQDRARQAQRQADTKPARGLPVALRVRWLAQWTEVRLSHGIGLSIIDRVARFRRAAMLARLAEDWTPHVPSELKETLESVRGLSAAGDFAAARSRLEGAARPAEASMRNLVHRQTLTLEVLEGLDVVRQLLERGKIEKASRTAERIAVALEKPDYAAL